MLKTTLLLVAIAISGSAHSTFSLPTAGCPIAHCSIYAGNVDPDTPPPPSPMKQFGDTETGGSLGLGCVTNNVTGNRIVACTYDNGPTGNCPNGNPQDTLIIYDMTGTILYNSYCLFDGNAWKSVPIISSSGDVFMSDDATVARISPTSGVYPSQGDYTWCMNFTLENTMTGLPQPAACGTSGTTLAKPPGASISPILLTNGTMIVFATSAPGYVFAFYADDGTFVAATQVSGTCSSGTCYYESRNTPAASYDSSNNRFYVSMNAYHNFTPYLDDDGYGMLVALQVTGSTITTEWSYSFNGPSGASPVVLPVPGGSNSAIYFDGYGSMDPMLFKITDTGGSSTFNWESSTLSARIPASVTIDSAHNCAWFYSLGSTTLNCADLGSTYTIDYSVDVSTLASVSGDPASAMTLTTTSGGEEVLILGIQAVGSTPGQVLAVGLVPNGSGFGNEYWIFSLPGDAEFAPSQFPIITNTTDSYQAIAFPSDLKRMYLYGD
jgi:hypothetical protein